MVCSISLQMNWQYINTCAVATFVNHLLYIAYMVHSRKKERTQISVRVAYVCTCKIKYDLSREVEGRGQEGECSLFLIYTRRFQNDVDDVHDVRIHTLTYIYANCKYTLFSTSADDDGCLYAPHADYDLPTSWMNNM